MKRIKQLRLTTGIGASLIALSTSGAALAQEQTDEGSAFDTIVVTATKKADAQDVQSVPLAVTAFGAEQLENQHVRTLDNLGFSVPNVQLDDVGTAPGGLKPVWRLSAFGTILSSMSHGMMLRHTRNGQARAYRQRLSTNMPRAVGWTKRSLHGATISRQGDE